MPWGANRLHHTSTLDTLKTTLYADDTSSTGLRWHPDYHAKRVVANDIAGSWEKRLNQPTVSARRYPLYCRHVVWMLAHDEPIPEGHDIEFIDGDPHNLKASNLSAVPRAQFRQSPTAGVERRRDPISIAARNRATMPTGITFERKQYGYVVNIHIRKDVHPISIADTPKEAGFVGLQSAMVFKYLGDLVDVQVPAMPPELATVVTRRALAIYTPLGTLTPSQQLVRDGFVAELRVGMKELNEHRAQG